MSTTESRQEALTTTTTRKGELATAAMAAKAKAEVEARYMLALHRPRVHLEVRAEILDACKRAPFAAEAIYRKPIGGKFQEGLSIRFAETALAAMRNVTTETSTIHDDDESRTIHIAVTDLERNITYGEDITLAKTVERRNPAKDAEVIARRTNSKGEPVFIVRATEDDLRTKVDAAKSKVIRNQGLRLVPSDILAEAEAEIRRTRDTGGADPSAEAKKLADGFVSQGVYPSALAEYLGHALELVTKAELAELRGLYQAIRDGEATFADVLAEAKAAREAKQATATPAPTAQPSNTTPKPLAKPQEEQELAEAGLAPEQPATQRSKPKQQTPQEELADKITAAGGNFDQYVAAVRTLKYLPADLEYPDFASLESGTARRHLRALPSILDQIRQQTAKNNAPPENPPRGPERLSDTYTGD